MFLFGFVFYFNYIALNQFIMFIHSVKGEYLNYTDHDAFRSGIIFDFEGENFGEAFIDPLTLYHDVMEHSYENSKYFRTEELSIEGEAVAMGIRVYLETYYGFLRSLKYLSYYNIYEESWNNVLRLLTSREEGINEGGEYYDIAEYFEHHKEFSFKEFREFGNEYKPILNGGFREEYWNNLTNRQKHSLMKAFAYGQWLGEYLYEDLNYHSIVQFFENYEFFLKCMEVPKDNLYEEITVLSHWDQSTIEVKIFENDLRFYVDGEVLITSKTSKALIERRARREQRLTWQY